MKNYQPAVEFLYNCLQKVKGIWKRDSKPFDIYKNDINDYYVCVYEEI